MPRKKQKGFWSYVGSLFYYVGLGTMYVSKGVFTALKFSTKHSIRIAKEQNTKRKAIKQHKERPRTKSKFSKLIEIKAISGNLTKFQNHILKSDSTIGIILGARGTGKSAIGLKLLENANSKRKKVYAIGFNAKDMPNWIHVVDNIEQIQNDSFVLIDEGGITFSSRKSMSNANQVLSSLLLIARHKNISVLFITQNSSNLEVNVLRQADFLVMKPSSLLQKDFERKKIKELYTNVSKHFNDFKDMKGITYIHSDKFQGFATNDLPSFWNVKVSKAFK